MCGIGGIWHPERDVVERTVGSINRAQAHRGPDDEGAVCVPASGGWLGFAHRRLAIIDVSPAGHQPMQDIERGNWIVFNGEIYNFRELRRELEDKGEIFRTGTDTEVILKAYGVWGKACVERFRGIFAFGLWDACRETLFLARDQLGVKPLYLWQNGKQLVFASEVRAILATGLLPRTLDTDGYLSYLAYGSVQEPFTLIRKVRSLPAGHWMQWGDGTVRTERYWRLPSLREVRPIPTEKLYTQLAERLADAVAGQLVADVPLGAFLSGGIDSTAIAALMQNGGTSQARTFSLVFQESAYDEREYSRLAASHLETRHTEVLLTGSMFRDGLDAALDSYDQPSADGLNTWFVSKAAREAGLTVALSGVGGDEVFGGYNGYRRSLGAERYGRAVKAFPRPVRSCLARLMSSWDSSEALRKAAALLTTLRHPYFLTRRFFLDHQIDRLVDAGLSWTSAWELGALDPVEQHVAGHDPINKASAFEIQTYMLSTLLRDTDQMSMAHSLEIRVPLIDHNLVEFLFTLPGRCKLDPRLPKPLLTTPLRNLLPPECVHRPKRGFELPFKVWITESLHKEMEESFCGRVSESSSLPFSPSGLSELWHQFLGGKVNWSRIWSVFVLRRWMERHCISASSPTCPFECQDLMRAYR